MQDDLTWGVKALIANGTADPKRIGISGGYAPLAGVAFTQNIYAAAVAIVALSTRRPRARTDAPTDVAEGNHHRPEDGIRHHQD